jgi:hypothetical protein
MMRQFLALFVVALFAVSGARAEQDLYNPLAVGLRWDVDVEMTTPGGGTVNGSAVREILGTKTINDVSYFIVKTSFTGLPSMKDITMYRRKTARGIYAINALDKEGREFLEAALPLAVGQSWKTVIFSTVVMSTVEAKESVTVGGKTYEDCVKVVYKTDRGPSGTYYQAPDVGNVLETTTINGAKFKFSLKAFSGLK